MEDTKSKKEAAVFSAYQAFFKTPQGKIILDDLYDFCLKHLGSYSESQSLVNFEEGKRCIFVRILRMASIDIKKYMINKATDENIYDY